MIKADCFAFTTRGCKALKRITCDGCTFYKPKGTECDTCSYKDTGRCEKCHEKE